MKLNVSSELKQPGKVSERELSERLPATEYLGRTVEFAAPVTLKFAYSFDGKGIGLKGVLSTAILTECARCTKPMAEPLVVNFEERFVREKTDEESEDYLFWGETLDLDDMVQANIFLNLPLSSVCSADCRGLCGVCGCDLNVAQCSCVKEAGPQKGALSELEQLLSENKEV